MKTTFPLLLGCLMLVASCNQFKKQNYNPQKLGANDPFKTTMVGSEFFEVEAGGGKVIEGKKGTIVSFPKGCFVDDKGNEIKEKVKIELAEALTMDEMMLSGLTTTSNGKLLETDGMIYLNPTTAAGANVFINPKKPVQIQIPTAKKRAGMSVYIGKRDDNGKMDWTDPKPIETYLEHVDLNQLDFLPPGFADEVKKGMPFKEYKTATKELTDSLYFSLSAVYNKGGKSEIEQNQSPGKGGFSPTPPAAPNYNEPYYNPDKKVENGKYTDESYNVHGHGHEHGHTVSDRIKPDAYSGIDPAVIKALLSDKFNTTFIATREFETRLRIIFKTCNNEALLLYVNNTDKDLWEVDEMAAKQLGEETRWGKKFMAFARLKQTNVRNAGENAAQINSYFAERLNAIKAELTVLDTKAQQQLQEHRRIADSVATAYKELLFKRETYRMERYNFEWTNTGWVNVDTGTAEKNYFEKKLEVTIPRGKEFDRVETYIVFEGMKSIYHLETLDKEVHFVGQHPQRSMLMPSAQKSKIAAVGYKDDKVYMGVVDFVTGSSEKARVALAPSSSEAVKRVLQEIEKGTFKGDLTTVAPTETDPAFSVNKPTGYSEENSVAVDLAYQDFFYREQLYQEAQWREAAFIVKLYQRAFPCDCGGTEIAYGKGQTLFNANCAACHKIFEDGTGPALVGITDRRSIGWLISFTRNWHDLVAAGDRVAIDVTNSRPTEMNVFVTLDECDIKSIYAYVQAPGYSTSQ
ncbi:MAG: cytochrome c [Chitinophagales bacterium]|nr:cytochrome c [Chitinophagales bacterium]